MNPDFKKILLKETKASNCEEIEVIQSLWSGYGKISRYSFIKNGVKHAQVYARFQSL